MSQFPIFTLEYLDELQHSKVDVWVTWTRIVAQQLAALVRSRSLADMAMSFNTNILNNYRNYILFCDFRNSITSHCVSHVCYEMRRKNFSRASKSFWIPSFGRSSDW